jgi:hypothetical protein
MHAVRSASVRSHLFQQGSFGNEDPRSYFRHSFQFIPPASVEHSVDEGPIGSSMINVLLTGWKEEVVDDRIGSAD